MLHLLSIWSVVLPVFAGIVFWRSHTKPSWIIFTITFMALFPQLAVGLSGTMKNLEYGLYNVYTLLEALLYSLFFFIQIPRKKNRKILITLAVAYYISTLFLAHSDITKEVFHEWICFANLLYLFLILLFLYDKFKDPFFVLYWRNPVSWFIIGLLFYAPTTFLMFAFYPRLSINHNADFSYLWIIHSIFNCLMYILFAIGFYINTIRLTNKNAT